MVLTRRSLLATAALGWFVPPPFVSADVEWCFDDPPVHVRLPDGAPVNVNVRVGVPAGRRDQLKAAITSGEVVADQAGSAIQITSLVPEAPDGSFAVGVTASAGKEHVQAVQSGVAGTPIVLLLPLPAA